MRQPAAPKVTGFLEGLGTTNTGAFLFLFPGTMRYVIAWPSLLAWGELRRP
jgi:hypothetical protein